MYFDNLPTVDELVKISSQITPPLAREILTLVYRVQHEDRERLTMINTIVGELVRHGAECWGELRWSFLLNRIHNLSHEINDNVDRLARR